MLTWISCVTFKLLGIGFICIHIWGVDYISQKLWVRSKECSWASLYKTKLPYERKCETKIHFSSLIFHQPKSHKIGLKIGKSRHLKLHRWTVIWTILPFPSTFSICFKSGLYSNILAYSWPSVSLPSPEFKTFSLLLTYLFLHCPNYSLKSSANPVWSEQFLLWNLANVKLSLTLDKLFDLFL